MITRADIVNVNGNHHESDCPLFSPFETAGLPRDSSRGTNLAMSRGRNQGVSGDFEYASVDGRSEMGSWSVKQQGPMHSGKNMKQIMSPKKGAKAMPGKATIPGVRAQANSGIAV